MADDGFVREIVMRMADGSEYTFEAAQIDQVDVSYDYGGRLAQMTVPFARAFGPARVDVTIKLHSDSATWRVGKPPRDVTPRPARLSGRPPELPPHA
jgi:hypothetical protein